MIMRDARDGNDSILAASDCHEHFSVLEAHIHGFAGISYEYYEPRRPAIGYRVRLISLTTSIYTIPIILARQSMCIGSD